MCRLLVLLPAILVWMLLPADRPALADGSAAAVEEEFRQAIRRVTPATVVCVAAGERRASSGFSSGVIVSPEGLVLSDGDAGLVWRLRDGRRERAWREDLDVRVPRRGGSGFTTYRARVLHRDRTADTTLIRILQRPTTPFPYVPLGDSDALEVGDFAFILGTAFDEGGGAPPTLTAGIVSSFARFPRAGPAGRYEFIFSSAAVNEGVNGGPLVDLDGRLVGTISTYVEPDEGLPQQFLGKIVPVRRILASHRGAAGASTLTVTRSADRGTRSRARSLEMVFHAAGEKAHPAVVSLEVERSSPVSRRVPFDGQVVDLIRYDGPVSGLIVSPDGWIVTALYNLTNVGMLVEPLWDGVKGAGVEEGLEQITG
ncbi:MAG: S1C family serine protease, partial [Planctomycetota bacterium]